MCQKALIYESFALRESHLYVVGNANWAAVYSLADPLAPEILVNCRYDLEWWSSVGYLHDIYVRNDTAYCNAEWRGLFVVDFTDMQNPVMIGSMPVYPQQGYNHSGWLMDHAPYYAMADETHGMAVKIVDVSDMQNLVVTDTITSGVHPYSIPHNVLYRDDFLYVSYYFDGMYVFDASDPANPVIAGFYDTSDELHLNNDYRGCWGVYPFLPSGNVLASDMQTGLWVFDVSQATITSVDGPSVDADRPVAFPNPFTDRVFVKGAVAGSSFIVRDLSGRELLNGNILSDGSLPEAHRLPSGIMMLSVQYPDGAVWSTRLVRK
jgi:hypothetical protein